MHPLKLILSQSELFRFFPISVSEPIRIIPNQSEKHVVSRLMKNVQKSNRINPINSETSIRMNPNQSKTKFSIQVNPNQSVSDWSNPNFQSESIRMNPMSEWFGKILIENLVLDCSDSFALISRNESDQVGLIFDSFSSNDVQNVFRIGSEWFELARIQISEWIGIVLIGSEIISTRYFRQGHL